VFDGGCPEAWIVGARPPDNVNSMILYQVYRDGVLNHRATGTSS